MAGGFVPRSPRRRILGSVRQHAATIPKYRREKLRNASYPKTRFVALAGGLVLDALTGLVWQDQAAATQLAWADAQSFCSALGSSFRLPTFKELYVLEELSRAGNAGLPTGLTGEFWTSAPVTNYNCGASACARFVDFPVMVTIFEAEDQHADPVSATHNVLCVR